jgi:NCS1 family nucleobase:cation symporter-1
MALYAFIGVAVTCAAVVVFRDILVVEDAPWDPAQLLKRFTSPAVVVVSMLALVVATLTTNIAANVVSPANDFSNLAPRLISFRTGGLLTALAGVLIMPWKLIASTDAYIFKWLIGYGALLGPIGGIMIADYYVVRRRRLAVAELYEEGGRYGIVSPLSLAILAVAVAPNVPGFLAVGGFVAEESVPAIFRSLYTYAWFVGFGIAFVLYALLRRER